VKRELIVPFITSNLLETWKSCGGYYECPKKPSGGRLGPLVAYAGKYKAPDGNMQHYVGDVYYNYAFVEEHPRVNDHFASLLAQEIRAKVSVDVVLGAPLGGMLLAAAVARSYDCRVIFAEKKVISAGTPEKKEESELVLDRHRVRPGDQVVVAEDVCNNFSTTDKLAALIGKAGGIFAGVVCALNRSGKSVYNLVPGPDAHSAVPVLTTLFIPTKQYQQDDPAVAYDVAAGNVCWAPKQSWDWLLGIMAEHS
jgi:orotate phosphoribosyltransferase